MKQPSQHRRFPVARRSRRAAARAGVGILALALAALAPVGQAAASDAPANDSWQSATQVNLGDHLVVATAGATADAFDVDQSLQWCGTPIASTVWFKLDPTESVQTIIDVTQSDYPAVFILFQGRPDANPDVLDPCSAKTLTAPGVGPSYYLMVGSLEPVSTGRLVLDISRVRSPTIHVSVDPFGSVTRTGSAAVSGQYTCTEADGGNIYGNLTQQVGRRFSTSGSGAYDAPMSCDGQAHPYRFTLTPQQGEFGGGKATLQVYGYATSYGASAEDDPLVTVRLRGR